MSCIYVKCMDYNDMDVKCLGHGVMYIKSLGQKTH